MNTDDLQDQQDVIAMAERIFRGTMKAANYESVDEVCPFTLESLLSCPARNNKSDQEPCPYSLDKCVG